jgi:hypothetical protein
MPVNVVGDGVTECCNIAVPATVIVAVLVFLAAFPSFPAPVATVTVDEPAVDGVPAGYGGFGRLDLLPGVGIGEQVPVIRPAGKPVMLHVAPVAEAVAEELLAHFTVPE